MLTALPTRMLISSLGGEAVGGDVERSRRVCQGLFSEASDLD